VTRVTSETMVTGSLRRLSTRLDKYEKIQSQLATGKRIITPSDSPGDANRTLGLRAVQRAREQETRNAADAESWLNIADAQLQGAMERLGRARDLTVRGASSHDVEERRAIAAELRNVRDELVGIANFRNRGRPLFSGYSDATPVRHDGTGWVYDGDDGAVTRRVGESDVVRINLTAPQVFGFVDPADPSTAGNTDVFTVIDDVIAQLDAGDLGGLSASISVVDGARARVGDALAEVGAASNTVKSAMRRTEDTLLAVRGELAEIEDVDLAEAVMELQTQEAAYQATLQALARALPPSLVSFLR
jgi:flagellar hook-associated protein 3 FlgL